MRVYRKLAGLVNAIDNCKKSNNPMADTHTEMAQHYTEKYMPSGSGFNCGTTLDFEKSKTDKMVFESSYHKMDDNGYYNGWLNFEVTVTPSFISEANIAIKYDKRLTNDEKIKYADYIEDEFYNALMREMEEL